MRTTNKHPRTDESVLLAWRALLGEAQDKPWLAGLLARHGVEIFNRFIHFYRQLQGLPRHLRRALNARLRRRLATTLLGAALLLAFNPVRNAQAATITVDGNCTLADAITAANTDTATGNCVAGSGADNIDLQTDVILTGTLPEIETDLTLDGNGNTIDANGVGRALYIYDATVTINDVTLTGGDADVGAGILTRGTSNLTIHDSTITGNQANWGGGIYGGGESVTINNSTISNNSASYDSGTAGGGAIYSYYQVTINNSTISGNTAQDYGGATYVNGQLTITNSTLTGNSAGSTGGGIYSYSGNITLNRTIISGNTSGSGGNEIYLSSYGSPTVTGDNFNVFGHSGDAGTAGFTPGSSDKVPDGDVSAILDSALADNGGPTLTHALVSGSPAIDIAPDAACAASPIDGVDQRGAARNIDGDGSPSSEECDAGAVEYASATAIRLHSLQSQVAGADGLLASLSALALAIGTAGYKLWARARPAE